MRRAGALATGVLALCVSLSMTGMSPVPAPPDAAPAPGPIAVAQDDSDEWGGLPPGEGREAVYGLCSACHSLKLVQQQGLSRESWGETLDWMVEKQGMPALDPESERLVLDYLAEHYGPGSRGDGSLSGWGRPSFE